MVTKVGMQTEFADALKDLMELDYDAVEAYDAAIDRLDNAAYIAKLAEFKKDHQRHISEIDDILSDHQIEAPAGPSGKQWLTKGKVILANLIGDEAILKAMISNETDTNTAYQRMNERTDIWVDAREMLKNGLADEQKHKAWLETLVSEDDTTLDDNVGTEKD
jgi:rubrerythrin